ncbi:MAG: hypothetical protein NZ480_02260 [Bdellovibrionaceae bacterium]|nr:hypothetical protein [Pseudobdellovibrionaceae bacterium]MDW8190804.1 hypothetical protein [Pseudobdellovibrionaceae bacterium]
MNILEQLKQQVFDLWENLITRIREQGWYLSLEQKWEQLEHREKVASVTAGLFIIMLIIFLPAIQNYNSSQDILSQVDEKQDLIHNLMITQKELNEFAISSVELSPDALQEQLKSRMIAEQILPEQIEKLQPLDQPITKINYPEDLILGQFQLNLKQLTIKQIQQVQKIIHNISKSIKVINLFIHQDPVHSGYLNMEAHFLLLKFPTPVTVEDQTKKTTIKPSRGRQ